MLGDLELIRFSGQYTTWELMRRVGDISRTPSETSAPTWNGVDAGYTSLRYTRTVPA